MCLTGISLGKTVDIQISAHGMVSGITIAMDVHSQKMFDKKIHVDLFTCFKSFSIGQTQYYLFYHN